MDSINQNQEEKNHEDLNNQEAVKKIKDLVSTAESCFFCTNLKSNEPFATRPMAVQKVDDEGNLWFLSSVDSHKNEELKDNDAVQLLFQGDPHTDFMSIFGHATVSKDQAKIDELWNPLLKTWFTEGKEDPRITVIKVTPSESYYWDSKHGKYVAFAKMALGAVLGKTLDDSIEGKLNP
ncbi:pyridoxamine 5'-phosphate oxidase family protein [Halpernia frigidisoli]|uniref:General stress protein 26 n=1 Tax=Halpernia frigidisoli TaxID=1125876 RepID=A0A1I3GIJ7_9FLAO|nr:pyridoxamine 5'-phosphate oxidase family protein [Halpernia frigidisoli]SFI23308.1 General stress protein 26 [Halpernia frigidisoli]